MPPPRILLLLFSILLCVAWFLSSGFGKKTRALHLPLQEKKYAPPAFNLEKAKEKAAAAASYAQRKGFNTDVCFLIDMSLPSGQYRFFVYNLKKDSIRYKALVAHGNCFQYWLEGRRYSNVVGSGCTSLGKYKIGNSYTGRFGYSYKLHGLDSTNNKAFERTVVLHAHSCIPDTEVSDEICQSNGCPTVSPGFLETLKPIINHSRKPVLLWIYD